MPKRISLITFKLIKQNLILKRGEDLSIVHFVVMDSDLHDQKRMLNSFWDALGDVGGFHDGLVLLIKILVGPFAAHGFFLDLVKMLRQEPFQSQSR